MSLRILHCVEFYHPSPGGSQAVVRHVSEQLVRRGHDVTVATTRHPDRRFAELEGVRIEEFDVSGNTVRGLKGEVERYRSFVTAGGFDILMTYSAQQWTTDALLPMLDRIDAVKVLAPCGFSRLRDPAYAPYFSELPARLAEFDQLIFHGENYQDIEFTRGVGLENLTVVPNGASREEFEGLDSDFRERHGVDPDEPLLLTVGPHNWIKGHALTIEAFRQADFERGTLVVIGNKPLRVGCQWDCRRRAVRHAGREPRAEAGNGDGRAAGGGARRLQGGGHVRLRLAGRMLPAGAVRGGGVANAVHQHGGGERERDRGVDRGRTSWFLRNGGMDGSTRARMPSPPS